MFHKTLSALAIAAWLCCGSVFAAQESSSSATNSWSSTSTTSSTGEVADSNHRSCGSSCSKPKSSCNSSCNSCDMYEDYKFTGHVDWLWRKMRRCGLDFAVEDSDSLDEVDGHCCDIGQDFDHGVRVGLSYSYCGCWDLAVEYSYWSGGGDGKCSDSDENLVPTRTFPTSGGNDKAYARSDFEATFHIIDLTAGYKYYGECDVTVRPFAGSRFIIMDQDMTTNYSKMLPFDQEFTGQVHDTVYESIDMKAYGLIAGVETSYKVWNCLSLFGRFAATAAYADMDVSYLHKETFPATETLGDFECDCSNVIFIFEISSGVEYRFTVCDCFDLGIAAGWEYQSWHGVTDFINFTSFDFPGKVTRGSQSFGLEGLFVRLSARY